MTGESFALRLRPALRACVALACCLVAASPARAGGAVGPDPSPTPAPDPYTAPAAPHAVAPAEGRVVRTPAPSRARVTGHTAATTHAPALPQNPRPAPPAKTVAERPAAPAQRTVRTGPARSFSAGLAAAVAPAHPLSRALALTLALLVLLSGAFVLTAAREIAR